MDMFAVNHLCRFYSEQYGMIFDIKYNPVYGVLKGKIEYKNAVRKFAICCIGVSEKAVLNMIHAIIYDVLAKSERSETEHESKQV